MKRERRKLEEVIEWPFLEGVEFALAFPATLDHRSARMGQETVPVDLYSNRVEYGQREDHGTRVGDHTSGVDLGGKIFGMSGKGHADDQKKKPA